MKDSIVLKSSLIAPRASTAFVDRAARRLLFAIGRRIEEGRIRVVDEEGTHEFGEPTVDFPVTAILHVHDPRFFGYALLRGSVGGAEAYMMGLWDCDDLTSLVRIIVRNRHAMDAMDRGISMLTQPAYRLFHALRRNTVAGSRENITAHYDLGNDFYELFLDETMTYSCGIFERDDATLTDASTAKIERLCRKLDLKPEDHLLEIGTGWGALAIHAATRYGCRVTTTTISEEQHRVAQERISAAGLEDRVQLLLADYRTLDGRYDKLVSVEMIEAVGHEYYDAFFETCSRLLRSDGIMLLQSITMTDQRYEAARSSVDFIRRYIFPGGCIPSITALAESMTRSSDLKMTHLEDITPHYALTLRAWHERFLANKGRIEALGYPESFLRMWELYLCYCEAGFAERYIGTVQVQLAKPGARHEPLLGELRPHRRHPCSEREAA